MTANPDPIRPSVRADAALGVAVLVAFSPVLVDLARFVTAVDGRPAILIAPVLLVLATRGQSAREPVRRGLGRSLMALGVALELVGILLASSVVARMGLPVAALGFAALRGLPGMRRSALLFWVVPIPVFVFAATTPWLESIWAATVDHALAGGLGLDISATGPLLRAGSHTLELESGDNGVWLAWVLAELGWYRGLVHGASALALLRRAALFALWALPGQLVASLVAGLLLVGGLGGLGRVWLDWGLHVVAAIGVLAWTHATDRRRRATS